jgi:hypothetical protein
VNNFDSRPDTYQHIQQVQRLLGKVVREFTPKLAGSTYGSEEYKGFLAAMKPALDHHYANNSHHPEHWPGGVQDMSLLDVLEMLVDWKAATMRHANGDIRKSIEINQQRFGFSDELKRLMLNTLELLERGD